MYIKYNDVKKWIWSNIFYISSIIILLVILGIVFTELASTFYLLDIFIKSFWIGFLVCYAILDILMAKKKSEYIDQSFEVFKYLIGLDLEVTLKAYYDKVNEDFGKKLVFLFYIFFPLPFVKKEQFDTVILNEVDKINTFVFKFWILVFLSSFIAFVILLNII